MSAGGYVSPDTSLAPLGILPITPEAPLSLSAGGSPHTGIKDSNLTRMHESKHQVCAYLYKLVKTPNHPAEHC